MVQINPIEVLFWNIRRNEKDVIQLYDKLAPLMQLGAGSNMLNFGLWDKNAKDPLEAQKRMCQHVSDFGQFQLCKRLLDLGSGYGTPALLWRKSFSDLEIFCLNLNFNQLDQVDSKKNLSLVNATSTAIPLGEHYFDRIVALESAHHFKPLSKFFHESKRVLSKEGKLIIAIPVTENKHVLLKLGILSFTWTSQHYSKKFIENQAKNSGFIINKIEEIGSNVYEPLANYYLDNRNELKKRFGKEYSDRIEGLVFRSIKKMKKLSQEKVIEYLLMEIVPNH